jgi:hypothetical protein
MNKEVNKKEVLKETFKFIRSKPIILIPMIILVLFSRLQDYLASSYIGIPDNIRSIEDLMPILPLILAYFIISSILLCIIYAIIEGIYTVTIKNMFENKDVNLGTASGLASKKASLLIAAGLLIGLMISAGTLFLIIPGMYFMIWYFYTIPFIMLENRGVLDGMKASKEFARNKKSDTIYFLTIPFLYLFLCSFIAEVVLYKVPMAYYAITIVLDSIIFTWYSVIPVYVYSKEFGVEARIHMIGK